jgi:type III secretion protein J
MFKLFIMLMSVSLFTNCTFFQFRKDVVLVQGVTQENANNIVLVLENNNVTAQKLMDPKDGTFSITVAPKNEHLGLQILSNYGEPVTKHQTMGQIFKKEGMISSPMEEFARYTDALNQELESTIAQIDGIISVKVQVSLPMPSDNLWSSEAAKPGAAIFIKYRPGYRIDLLTNRLKLLVSKAVPGLTPEMVEIMPYQKKEAGSN